MNGLSGNVTGANAGRSRSLNRRIVLGQIRDAVRIGRAEIARATGLTTQTVSNIIAELEQDQLLVEDGRRSSGRGLPAVLYTLNPEGGFSIGIEVRPDALLLSVVDLTGRELWTYRESLETTEPEAILERIVHARKTVFREADLPEDRLLGIGLVLPGPFGQTGLSASASELPDWQQLNVAEWMEDRLEIPVMVENDANAAAMSERVSGAARELNSFAYLYFGAGLGLGLIQDGSLVRGAFGNAGEIGHVSVPGANGPVLLQQAVSRLSVQAWLAAHGIIATSSAQLAHLFEDNDPHLIAWADRAAEALSPAIAMIENIFDPQAIVLGGAMPAPIVDRLIDSVMLADNSVSNRPDRVVPRLLRGGCGRMTAARGAAALMVDRSFTPQIAAEG